MTVQELENIFRNVLAEGVTLDIWVYVLMVVALVAGSFGGAYAKRRGENLATKKDFSDLLDQMKQTTTATEVIKTEIARINWVDQKRWELRQTLYTEVLETLWGLRFKANLILQALDTNGHERVPLLMGEFSELVHRLQHVRATAGITFGDEAISVLDELAKTWDQITRTPTIEARHLFPAYADIANTAHQLLTDEAKTELRMSPIGEPQT